MIMGTGFSPFRVVYLNMRTNVARGNYPSFKTLAQTVDQWFKPCGYLLKIGQDNLTFYR